jgi:hypothetical protein
MILPRALEAAVSLKPSRPINPSEEFHEEPQYVCRRQTCRLSAANVSSFHILFGKDNYKLEREEPQEVNSRCEAFLLRTMSWERRHHEADCTALLGMTFEPEDGGNMFLRNVSWLSARLYIPGDSWIPDPLTLRNEYMYYYVFQFVYLNRLTYK